MDSKSYIANAMKTESVPASLDINQIDLHQLLTIAILAAELANQVKRKLFYGKPLTRETVDPLLNELMVNADNLRTTMEIDIGAMNVPIPQDQFDAMVAEAGDSVDAGKAGIRLDNLNIRLLHSALGMFSESGEVLEALMKQFEGGKAVLDGVNALEELGDISWYQAIAVDELCGDLDAVRDTNIAKLKARYPDKFSAEAALNRDVAAERVILERGSVTVVENEVSDQADMAECLAIRRNGVLIQTMAGTPVAS